MAFQGDSIYWVEVEKVVPNPFQPRLEFDENKLQELAESIRMYGVLQPLTVTRTEVQRDDGTFYTEYELIAGERRLRASKLAGVAQVPVIIREGEQSQQEKLELAIIENLQREDLNAVDRALAFRQLADTFGLAHAEVAKKVGRSREYVSNSIRLLGLPDHMLVSLKRGEMMEGHARTLLMLTDRPEEQEVVYKEILLKKLSVREVERIVRKIATDKVRKKNSGEFDANLIELEKQFTETLGTRVQIQKTDFGGKLTIDYFSEDDLSVILKRIKDEERSVEAVTDTEAAEKLSSDTPLAVATHAASHVPPAPLVSAEAPKEHMTPPLPSNENNIQTEALQPNSSDESTIAARKLLHESHVLAQLEDVKPGFNAVPSVSNENNPVIEPFAQPPVTQNHTPVITPTTPPTQPHQTFSRPDPQVTPSQVLPTAPESSPVPTDTRVEPAGIVSPAPQPAAQEPVQPTPKAPEEDESGLYSIRNFGV